MLRQRSISAVGVVLFAAIPAFLGGWVFAAAMLILAIAGTYELLRAQRLGAREPVAVLSYAAAAGIILVAAARGSSELLPAVIVLFMILALTIEVLRSAVETGLAAWTSGLVALVYVGLPLAYAVALRDLPGAATRHWALRLSDWLSPGHSAGLAWIGVVFAVTWLTDTAAYLAGRSFGKTKLVPRLSPGKTRVGAAAGLVAGAIAGPLAAWIFGAPVSLPVAAALGVILSLAGALGDLGESLIKRNLGIKDMGSLIPGHGGILDRIDALLFTFPLTYLLVRLLERLAWT